MTKEGGVSDPLSLPPPLYYKEIVMKNFFKKIFENLKTFWKKLIDYIKELAKAPFSALLPALLAEIIFWIPVWVPALLAIIIDPWWWSAVGAVCAFWAGPFTPAIPLQLALIGVFIKLFKNKKNKNKKGD